MPDKNKKKTKQPQVASYAFAQQYNSACHIMNFMNLDILQQLRHDAAGSDINLEQDAKYRTRREWFPITTRALVSWQKAMKDLHEKNGPFKAYVDKQMQEGVLQGRLIKENGKRTEDVLNPITQKVRLLLTPYNFTDASRLPTEFALEHQAEAYTVIPIFMQDGKTVAFDPEKNAYDELVEVKGISEVKDKKWDVAVRRIPEATTTLEAKEQDIPFKSLKEIRETLMEMADSRLANQLFGPNWLVGDDALLRYFPLNKLKVFNYDDASTKTKEQALYDHLTELWDAEIYSWHDHASDFVISSQTISSEKLNEFLKLIAKTFKINPSPAEKLTKSQGINIYLSDLSKEDLARWKSCTNPKYQYHTLSIYDAFGMWSQANIHYRYLKEDEKTKVMPLLEKIFGNKDYESKKSFIDYYNERYLLAFDGGTDDKVAQLARLKSLLSDKLKTYPELKFDIVVNSALLTSEDIKELLKALGVSEENWDKIVISDLSTSALNVIMELANKTLDLMKREPPSNDASQNANVASLTPQQVANAGRVSAALEAASESVQEVLGSLVGTSSLETPNSQFDFDYQSYLEQSADPVAQMQYYRYYKLNDSQKELLQLPSNAYCTRYNNGVLGFDHAFAYRYVPHIAEKHSYYMCSLNQLTLFGLGLDQNLETIDSRHPLHAAYQEFKQAMEVYPDNPWQNDSFNKSHFMEYHLAQLLRSDEKLKQQMIDTVEVIFPSWSLREQMEECQYLNTDGSLSSVASHTNHLLSKDAYLAYCYVQSLRFVWASANSKQAFTSILGLDPITSQLLNLPGAPGPNQTLKNASAKRNGVSFLDVWQTLRQKMANDPNIPKELASFSSHGVVLSFEDDLVELQSKNGVRNPTVMHKLGFALIDSYYGEGLKPMYRFADGKPMQSSKEKKATKDLTLLVKNKFNRYSLENSYNDAFENNKKIALNNINNEPTFEEKTRLGSELLFWAAEEGHLDIIDALVAKKAKLNVKDAEKRTPLMILIKNHHAKGALTLLKHKADIHAMDLEGNTALTLALKYEEHSCALKLIELGSDLTINDKLGQHIGHLAAPKSTKEIAKALVDRNVNLYMKQGRTSSPLKIALSNNNAEFALVALDNMVNYVNRCLERKNVKPEKRIELIKQTLKASGLNEKDVMRLFIESILKNETKSAFFLLEVMDEVPKELCHVAAGLGNSEMLLELMAMKKMDGKRSKALLADTPKHYANIPLLLAASGRCSAEVAEVLIKQGENMNEADYNNTTALMNAASEGNVDFMKVLLENGAKLEAINKHGMTALGMAAMGNKAEAMQLLINAMPLSPDKVHIMNNILLDISCWYRTDKAIEVLLKNGADVNCQGNDGETPLMNALAFEPDQLCIAKLLEGGADVNMADKNGQTPLMIAIGAACRKYSDLYIDSVLQVIRAGADINKADNEGVTPLLLATKGGNERVMEILIKAGAKVNTKDHNGKQVKDYVQDLSPDMSFMVRLELSKVTDKKRSTLVSFSKDNVNPDVVKGKSHSRTSVNRKHHKPK